MYVIAKASYVSTKILFSEIQWCFFIYIYNRNDVDLATQDLRVDKHLVSERYSKGKGKANVSWIMMHREQIRKARIFHCLSQER